MLRSYLLAGSVVPCLLAVAPAFSQNTASPASNDIVVTATRSTRAMADVPASVSVVTSDQIEGTPARTIDDVLSRVPSVDLPIAGTNEQHPTNTIVSMRGLSGIRSLVLLDGVPINDPFFGYVQWSEVPLETVDRVEVVRGGGAPLWGNYAMGGVINILTKPINKTGLVAESAGGSRGTRRADVHGALAGDGYGIGLDAGINHSDGYVEQVESARGAATVPTSFTARTVAVSGNADLAPDLTARARVSYYDNDQTFLTRANTNDQQTWRYTGTLSWTPREGGSIDLTAFHNDERFVTNNPGSPEGADPNDVEFVQNSHRTRANDWGASLIWTQTFSGVIRSLSAGADYHGVRGSDHASIFDDTGALVRIDTGSGNQRFLGGFAQADIRPVDRLQLLLSVRYQDFHSYDGVDDTPGGLGRVASRHDSDVDPRLSIRYKLPADFALRGAIYRAFRAPTLDNLYRGASVPGYILYANAALKPETLEGVEAGFDVDRGPLRLQATAYASRISDFLTYRYLDPATLPAGFDIGARLVNAGRARSRGVEAELTWRPSSKLAGTLAYTHADSIVTRNAEDPVSIGVQQQGIPRHRASASLDWTGPHGIRISPRVRYLSRTNGDPDAIYRTDAHFVADLGASAPLRGSVDVFGQIENLFDRRYVGTNDGFTAPLHGRPLTAVGGVRLKLGSL
ncbi:TonB-dependent receptor plug domain-containing protein [Sphingomonas sp. RIT328]|uniref:TonB-dependent receptor plug domain-containing protein n=1 Tax=Sphingomonas sp. RIT328 TaxID=1470591 RepID=UPI0004470C65|nr:TonB-dependent receptor [Sphingomonas sp. RIT328]EZP49985.1 TonB-dependent receptor [Sphingomonas sp. RIT328]